VLPQLVRMRERAGIPALSAFGLSKSRQTKTPLEAGFCRDR
jgi:hypothetical protein